MPSRRPAVMAANGGDNEHGAQGVWPEFDPFMVLDNLIEVPSGLYSPPAASPMQNAITGPYGSNPFDLTEVPGNGANSSVDGGAPPVAGTAITAPSSNAHQDVAASSASVHQGGLDCTGCQFLREIVHSNGFEVARLCIHGAVGVFYHVTLDVYHVNPEGLILAPAHQSFIDLMDRDYAWVKNYLLDYAQQRAAAGYTILQDSTSDFHEVLCTSMAGGVALADEDCREAAAPADADNGVGDQQVTDSAADAIQLVIEQEDMPAPSAPSQPNNIDTEEHQQKQEVRPRGRSRLAVQRERIRKLELRDISRYFHLPITKACKELRVCNTALKNISRKCGIKYWPHRTIKKIDTMIAKLRDKGNGSAAAMDEVQKLTESRRKIMDGIVDPEVERLQE